MLRLLVVLGLALGLASPLLAQKAPSSSPHAKWEEAISAFEKKDAEKLPPKGGIVFVGSSSIVRWDLDKSFGDLPIIKRGFGGSQLADSVYFAPRIVTKYEPRMVVLYAGDNDLQAGKSPEQIAADFDAFVKAVHGPLPKTKILYIAVKPSIQRRKLMPKVKATNDLIAARCAKDDDRLVFVDIAPLMLDDKGEPIPELFVDDGLHLSAAGYQRWTEKLRPLLK